MNATNVLGKPKTNIDFLPYNGDGFKLLIPSKWNPSKEVEYLDQNVRIITIFPCVQPLCGIVWADPACGSIS